jgi:hypothetical protein
MSSSLSRKKGISTQMGEVVELLYIVTEIIKKSGTWV